MDDSIRSVSSSGILSALHSKPSSGRKAGVAQASSVASSQDDDIGESLGGSKKSVSFASLAPSRLGRPPVHALAPPVKKTEYRRLQKQEEHTSVSNASSVDYSMEFQNVAETSLAVYDDYSADFDASVNSVSGRLGKKERQGNLKGATSSGDYSADFDASVTSQSSIQPRGSSASKSIPVSSNSSGGEEDYDYSDFDESEDEGAGGGAHGDGAKDNKGNGKGRNSNASVSVSGSYSADFDASEADGHSGARITGGGPVSAPGVVMPTTHRSKELCQTLPLKLRRSRFGLN